RTPCSSNTTPARGLPGISHPETWLCTTARILVRVPTCDRPDSSDIPQRPSIRPTSEPQRRRPRLVRASSERSAPRSKRSGSICGRGGIGEQRPSPVSGARQKLQPKWPLTSLLHLRLEGRDVGLAAQRHHAHLAVAIDRHRHLGNPVLL